MERHAFELQSLDETERFGAALARLLSPGDVVLLDGPLGAGKTTLVRAIAAARGADERAVSSPTYVVAQEYAANGVTIAHLDAYRLSGDDEGELELLGWDRLVRGDVVTLIEWGERVAGLIGDDVLDSGRAARLLIEPSGPESRSVVLAAPTAWRERSAWETVEAMRAADEDGASDGDRYDTTCRVTGRPVPASSPTWPFADERARMADLYNWFSGGYEISRPIEERDLEEGV